MICYVNKTDIFILDNLGSLPRLTLNQSDNSNHSFFCIMSIKFYNQIVLVIIPFYNSSFCKDVALNLCKSIIFLCNVANKIMHTYNCGAIASLVTHFLYIYIVLKGMVNVFFMCGQSIFYPSLYNTFFCEIRIALNNSVWKRQRHLTRHQVKNLNFQCRT